MPLSMQEKEALESYYKNHDAYDPSKAKEQQTADLAPRCMCGGGHVMGMCSGGMSGYADGGPVVGEATDDPEAQAQAEEATQANVDPKAESNFDKETPIPSSEQATDTPQAGIGSYQDLMRTLSPSLGQRLAQGATSGLAGLADSIVQGVGRAGNPGFQKNVEESRQNQKQNLINALREKYESDYKGQELGQRKSQLEEETRSHMANEKETEHQRNLTERGQNLMAQRSAQELALNQKKASTEESQRGAKERVEAAQKIIEAFEKGSAVGSFLGLSARPSKEEYNTAKEIIKNSGADSSGKTVVRIMDSSGKLHDLPASSLVKAKERDPGLQVIQ